LVIDWIISVDSDIKPTSKDCQNPETTS